jgi:DNA polymerase-3 subunit delta
VRAAAGARLTADLLASLFETPLEGKLVVEAGALRPGALRSLFEKQKRAAALPCYPDGRQTESLIDEELRDAGLTIQRDARQALAALLGGDRAVSRAEVRKLALYCAGRREVVLEDVQAVVGDVSGAALDRFVDLACGGDARGAIAELVRLEAAGTSPQGALAVLARHLADLHRAACLAEDRGVEAAVKSMRPPPHFSREGVIANQLRRHGPKGLAAALIRVQEATLAARLDSHIETTLTERLVLDLVGGPRRRDPVNSL